LSLNAQRASGHVPRYRRQVVERLEWAADLQRLLADGAGLAHGDGAGEFDVAHVRRALDGERAERDPSRDRQGLVQFSTELRDAISAAQLRAHARGATLVDAGDLLAVLP
jgi:hypothetical protein